MDDGDDVASGDSKSRASGSDEGAGKDDAEQTDDSERRRSMMPSSPVATMTATIAVTMQGPMCRHHHKNRKAMSFAACSWLPASSSCW